MSTVKLNWSVPAKEWAKFERFVEYKYGKTKGYIGREAERAMQEYAETDAYAEVEDLVDRLVQAAGREAGGSTRKNNSLDVGADGESARAYCRVSRDVKEEFSAHVEQTDLRLGKAFAHAIQIRREGGRAARVENKLERVVDDAESLLKVESDNADAGESMGKKERQTVQVCRHLRDEHVPDSNLPDSFPVSWVENAIEDVLCQNVDDPENYYIPTYLELVKDRLGYVTEPGKPEVLKREELVGPTPAYEQKPLDQLSKDERVEAIRVYLGRQARQNGGLRQLSVEQIREHLFEGTIRKETVRNYVEQAGSHGGYTTKHRHGKLRVRCKFDEVADEQLLEFIEHGEAESIDDGQQTIGDMGSDRGQHAIATDGGNYEVGKR